MLTIHTLDYLASAWRHCRDIRQQVFMLEQQVPPLLEWDAADASAIHLLARLNDVPVACARVLPDGQIGRMAVLQPVRRQGVGVALLHAAVAVCRQLPVKQARLSAQVHAVAFYQRAGFVVVSAPYLDANIPHVDMVLELL